MASPASRSLAVLALLCYLYGGSAVLLRARRQPDRGEGPGSEMRLSRCYQCSKTLRDLVHPSDSPLMTDEAWVRNKCSEGEAAYQCLQSEACLHDELHDKLQSKIHENFCNNVEGVVALAECWKDVGFMAIGYSCHEYSETQNNVTEIDDYKQWNCRNMELNAECLADKAKDCPQSAKDLVAGESAIFLNEACN